MQNGAKTLEEIEQGFLGISSMQPSFPQIGKLPSQALTVEQLERQLRGEDVVPSSDSEHSTVQESASNEAVVPANRATMVREMVRDF